MLFSRTVRLPSFMLVGEYCESLEDMLRVCRTLPFLPGSGPLAPVEHSYSIGLGMNGIFFAGIPYARPFSCPEQAVDLTFHSFQGGIYRVSPFEADAAGMDAQRSVRLTFPAVGLQSGRDVVYEFRRSGNTYAESRLYIPVGRLSAEAAASSRFRSREACRNKLTVA